MSKQTVTTGVEDRPNNPNGEENDQAVENFRQYLRIPSVHPNINYDACVEFLTKQAKSLGLPIQVFHCVPKKPIVVITWVGKEPSLSSIMLNSHMDVVPVFEDKWSHKPFDADMDEEGNIYARGSQDMKCVGIQFIEAVRRLKKGNVQLRRTVHLSFVPDEETGGVDGMKKFVQTNDFKNLNVGFALDEGLASVGEEYPLNFGERAIWHLEIHCPGHPGHGSLLLDNTAGEKVTYLLNKFYEFRRQEKEKLKNNPSLTIGDVTSVNLTQIMGGVQSNVIPPEFTLVIDCRLAVTVDEAKWEETINQWCKEAGEGVWIDYSQKEHIMPITKLDSSNPFWPPFKKAADDMKLKMSPRIFPGGTDSRFLRELGIPAIGFSPMNNTPVLLHDHDEFLNVKTFLAGIDIYKNIIRAVADVEELTG